MIQNYLKNKIGVPIILFFTIVSSLSYLHSGKGFFPAEEIDIPSAVGMDIIKEGSKELSYNMPISFYNFSTKPISTSFVYTGIGRSIGATRENRQVKEDKKFLLGMQKVVLVSEEAGEFGIEPLVNILFNNPNNNDISYFAVCGGKTEDILKVKIPGYPSSADYIQDIIKHSIVQNFFSNEYNLMDIYISLGSEGQNVVAPYIEIKENAPTITGMALFHGAKMVKRLNMDDAKIMNLLRGNNESGTLSIYENIEKYVDVYAKSKRTVKVSKENNKYSFTINLNLKGYVVSNKLFKNLYSNPQELKKIESALAKKLQQDCMIFINKMKNEYKVDCLNLGDAAASKYGRFTGTDWNKVVVDANIKVDTKVKVFLQGRGDFSMP